MFELLIIVIVVAFFAFALMHYRMYGQRQQPKADAVNSAAPISTLQFMIDFALGDEDEEQQHILERFFQTADEVIEEEHFAMQRLFSHENQDAACQKWRHTTDALQYARSSLRRTYPTDLSDVKMASLDTSHDGGMNEIEQVKSRLRPVSQYLVTTESFYPSPSSSAASSLVSSSEYLGRAISRLCKVSSSSTTNTSSATSSYTTSPTKSQFDVSQSVHLDFAGATSSIMVAKRTGHGHAAYLVEARAALRHTYASLA
jgi:hypothetical protein